MNEQTFTIVELLLRLKILIQFEDSFEVFSSKLGINGMNKGKFTFHSKVIFKDTSPKGLCNLNNLCKCTGCDGFSIVVTCVTFLY